VIDQELFKAATGLVRDEMDEVHDRRLALQVDRELLDEVPSGRAGHTIHRGVDAMRQITDGYIELCGEQRNLVLFGRVPLPLVVTQHVIQHHELPRDKRGARGTAIPVFLLVDGAVEGPRAEVVEVAAIAAIRKTDGQAARHEAVEKVTDVLPVLQPGKREVLPAQAVAAV
jgi:hypothetical protein